MRRCAPAEREYRRAHCVTTTTHHGAAGARAADYTEAMIASPVFPLDPARIRGLTVRTPMQVLGCSLVLAATLLAAPATAQDAPLPASPPTVPDTLDDAMPLVDPPAPMPTAAPPAAADPRTDAEREYDALYGNGSQEYDPVADPTLPDPANVPGA